MRSFFGSPKADRCSPQAKFFIGSLMERLELPINRVCLLHRPRFAAAGLPEPQLDRRLDDVIDELTPAQASALIDALRREIAEVT